jgi:8-hydroxy-5-deazaflavin:NADPH oxidoreductase
MKISFIGIGNVGFALADNLAKLGHEVSIAARDSGSKTVLEALRRNPSLSIFPIKDALGKSDIIFLAAPFDSIDEVLHTAGHLMTDKILVDCTNPIGPGLTHRLESRISGGEFVQNIVPEAKVVKAFSIYGFENFQNSAYPGYGTLKPAMLIAGNDPEAKSIVSSLCSQLGWEPVDTGDIRMSLHLEHMTLMWVNMGRVQKHDAGFVWARLTR